MDGGMCDKDKGKFYRLLGGAPEGMWKKYHMMFLRPIKDFDLIHEGLYLSLWL